MKLTFLGGADEVGASCTLVEIAGKRLLVDCGMRMNAPDGDRLPWLDPIQQGGGLDAIILTHAHMDHLGAMPVIHQSYPHIPIYMTPPTLALSSVLLLDSLKIMASNYAQEGEIPMYSPATVESFLCQSRPVALGRELKLFDGTISVFFFPAGHILGAASVFLVSKEGSILMGGDISSSGQLTIPGFQYPRIKPDAVVVESTYGGRLHANRKAEEGRILQQARQVLEQKGAILFPAFAIGRAQEVILLLSRAMEQEKIPKAPIFVDGMVKKVCGVYRSYPEFLTPWLKKRTQNLGDPFFPSKGYAVPISTFEEREKAMKMRPAIFISSSGMLTGGPSPLYAAALAEHPNCWIGITGYQDEEAPGRRLQEISAKGGGVLDLNGKKVELKCGVGTYGLSAHADTMQIVSMLTALEAKDVFLVHGDGRAREALEAAIQQACGEATRIHRPVIGEEARLDGSARGERWRLHRLRHPSVRQTVAKAEAAVMALAEKPLDSDALSLLAVKLFERDGKGRGYTVTELMEAAGYPVEVINGAEIERVTTLLSDPNVPFILDRNSPFLYQVKAYYERSRSAVDQIQEHLGDEVSVLDEAALKASASATPASAKISTISARSMALKAAQGAKTTDPTPQKAKKTTPALPPQIIVEAQEQPEISEDSDLRLPSEPLPEAEILVLIEEMFGHDRSLYKRSLSHAQKTVTLNFHFPAIAREKYKEEAKTFFARTRWNLLIRDQPHHQALQDKALSLIEGHWVCKKSVGIFLATQTVVLPIEVTKAQRELFAGIQAEYKKQTGFSLEAKTYEGGSAPTPHVKPSGKQGGLKMEINAAYEYLRKAFEKAPHQPYKMGLKQTGIELSFITPEIAALYEHEMEKLSDAIGVRVYAKMHANQHDMKSLALRQLPQEWQAEMAKEPQYLFATHEVRLVMVTLPPQDIQDAAAKAFFEQTRNTLSFALYGSSSS
jgi:Cft2 family RNA processing exonuclease